MSDFKVGDLVVLNEEWNASWYIKKRGLGVVIETTERKALVHWQSNMRFSATPYFKLKKLLDKPEKS